MAPPSPKGERGWEIKIALTEIGHRFVKPNSRNASHLQSDGGWLGSITAHFPKPRFAGLFHFQVQ